MTKSEYLAGIDPLPDDLLQAAGRCGFATGRPRGPSRRERRRLDRELTLRKLLIRKAREEHNRGLPARECITPEPPEPPEC